MTEQSQAEYFAARELLERDLGRRATDTRVAAAHIELAEHYEALARVFGAERDAAAPIATYAP